MVRRNDQAISILSEEGYVLLMNVVNEYVCNVCFFFLEIDSGYCEVRRYWVKIKQSK